MTEVKINKGQNIIDIYFDDFASCLVVKNALVVNWPDCRGSIGEYYSISDLPVEERNFYTKMLDSTLSEGSDSEQMKVVKEFLNLFSNGTYIISKFTAEIKKSEFYGSHNVLYSKDVPENERFSGAFYPNYHEGHYEPDLFSITNDYIDSNRVLYYSELIKQGKKPTILTFGVFNTLTSSYSRSYVLDGHHKIMAYIQLKQDIPTINILKSEECINKTDLLLKYVKPILKDFEYKHLFNNNDDNILEIDFVNQEGLTSDLDSILKNSDHVEVSIINVLKKYSNLNDQSTIDWLKLRLNILKSNKHINIFSFGKGLKVSEKRNDEKYGEFWFRRTIYNQSELKDWIKTTIK